MNAFNYRLNLFAGNTNLTSDSGLSDEMKTYYSDYLIDLAKPLLVHDQFAQKHNIPKNGGKIIEFRKYSPLPKLLTPLAEGVTPDGQKLSMSVINAEVKQYGGYVELSDILLMTAIDNNLVEATELLGDQAGRTLDTISREAMNAGTNVLYGDGSVSARYLLVGGEETGNMLLTVEDIKKGVRKLKTMNAPKIDGDYVAIINPDCTYDLTNDPKWLAPHQYVDTANVYSGEIGKIAGVRFVESTEAKIFTAADLATDARNLACNGAVSASTSVTFDGGTVAAGALVGRYVLIGIYRAKVTANTATTLTLDTPVTAADNTVIYPGEAGAKGRAVYSTLLLGANAYGTTEIEGGGLQHIVKQLGSAGTADPLNQRATAGWKATKVTKLLVDEYIVRLETASTFDGEAN